MLFCLEWAVIRYNFNTDLGTSAWVAADYVNINGVPETEDNIFIEFVGERGEHKYVR
jgi:hypothetical protein